MLAGIAAPHASLPQPLDQQHQIIESIREEQIQNGPYSEELLDPLTALGLLYQESGEHRLAAATIERALQVVRANHGLRSLDQALLIRQWIDNEEAMGNFAAAWDLEQRLLTLAQEHPDDLRTVSILREIGDRRMDLLERYLAGESPPEIIRGCFYAPEIRNHHSESCRAGSRSVAIQAILSEAQTNYLDAIRVILRHEVYSSDELRELETELVHSSYEHGRYDVGKQSLRRLLAYDVANSESWRQRIDAFIQIADWDLLFEFAQASALEAYEQAYELLKRQGIAQASIDQIFSPEMPVVLPVFLPNPFASDETRESNGYIDVAFDVTKYGTGRRIEILGATGNATDAAKEQLVRLIAQSRFRPRVTDGQFHRTSRIVVRHHLME